MFRAFLATCVLIAAGLVGTLLFANKPEPIPVAAEPMREPIPDPKPPALKANAFDRYESSARNLSWSLSWTDEAFDSACSRIVENYLAWEFTQGDPEGMAERTSLLMRHLDDLKANRLDSVYLNRAIRTLCRLPLHEPWGIQ